MADTTRDQTIIMIGATIVAFMCVFGCIALIVAGVWETADGALRVPAALALPTSFALTAATGYAATMLVCRPTRRGAGEVLLLAILALLPIFLLAGA